VRRPIGILAGTTATITAVVALTACGQTDDTRNFGTVTDCAKVGRPVVTNDPAGDQRASKGLKATVEPKGDLVRLRVAKSGSQLCAEFTAGAPGVQLEASVLSGQAPEALLDSVGNGQHFRKVKATVGISGKRLTVLIGREVFDEHGVGAIFRSFRFQARSAVAAKDQGRLTDCMPVCE
jgi:hypothetical protein